MLPNKLQLTLLVLNLFSLPVSATYNYSEGIPVCGNTAIQCYNDSFYGFVCDISGLDTELIQQTLYTCAQYPSFDYLSIQIMPGGVGVTLNITLPDNVYGLTIQNNFNEPIKVETSTVNLLLEVMEFLHFEISLNHDDFFSYFPSLSNFSAETIGSEGMPIFSNNFNLTEIDVYTANIRNISNRVITREMIGGLSKLEYFHWEQGHVTEIMPDAFYGLTSLQELGLSYNDIHQLSDCTFSDLVSLYFLDLVGNDITTVEEYTFIGLDAFIVLLVLAHNPSFPLSTLTLAKNISGFVLDFYDPSLINAQFFQQFPNLVYLSFKYVAFDCSCEYEWISKLQSEFNIQVLLDAFTSCPGNPGIQVDDSSLYTNCSNNVTYQCFNHSIVCEGDNWLRVDSGNSCLCTYPTERRFYNETSLVCSDIDECEDESTICEGICVNTFGSYTCSCGDGYVNVNETTCNDVNECMTANGGCSQNCTNTLGSYACSCGDGYVIANGIMCNDVNECMTANGGCSQDCTNTLGSYTCSCSDGYVIANGIMCNDVNECMTANGGCSQNCTNTLGSYACSCSDGYVIANVTMCDDVNECMTANGGCSQNCTNTLGSYACSCGDGYVIANGIMCNDVNECMTANGGCSQDCTNTLGSYTCSCSDGYVIANGIMCNDVNECMTLGYTHSHRHTWLDLQCTDASLQD